jgi:hypothetical protein
VAERRTVPMTVYLVNPPLPRPWRTQADYWNAQKRSRRVHIVALISIIIATVTAVGASIGAMAAMRGLAPVLPDAIRVECVVPKTP